MSYPLGLAWWAEAGLKIVALSMFMATVVFAITACLMARFFLWYFEKLVFTVCICTPARGGKRANCGLHRSSWPFAEGVKLERVIDRMLGKARLRFQCSAKRSKF